MTIVGHDGLKVLDNRGRSRLRIPLEVYYLSARPDCTRLYPFQWPSSTKRVMRGAGWKARHHPAPPAPHVRFRDWSIGGQVAWLGASMPAPRRISAFEIARLLTRRPDASVPDISPSYPARSTTSLDPESVPSKSRPRLRRPYPRSTRRPSSTSPPTRLSPRV